MDTEMISRHLLGCIIGISAGLALGLLIDYPLSETDAVLFIFIFAVGTALAFVYMRDLANDLFSFIAKRRRKDSLIKSNAKRDDAKKERADDGKLHEVSKVRAARSRVQVRDDADVRRVRVGRSGRQGRMISFGHPSQSL